jgi:NAD(P)-dependent dehydrogenase (short-subunit alcohol dehydrogenase family)
MGALDGRVAIITGAGRGLGREHALLFASEGAKVVVNDLGGDQQGGGADATPAQQTVDDIRAMGGEAVVNGDDVADWDGARRLVEQAVDTFGDLHVLVNNAGILRDRVIVNISENEWDSVVRVHLKGHFAPMHFAANYWREQTKSGRDINAAIVNTTSTSGLFANPGQANYDSAKSGIATLTQVAAKELVRYGVRANAIAPGARTRLTLSTPGLGEQIGPPDDGSFDEWSPANVSPFVAYLSTAECTITGETFVVRGGLVQRVQTWTLAEAIEQHDRWTVAQLAGRAGELAPRIPLVDGGFGNPQYKFD